MIFLKSFLIGGIICALVQILLDKTKLLPGRVMVLLVVLGTMHSAFMSHLKSGQEQGQVYLLLDLEITYGREWQNI